MAKFTHATSTGSTAEAAEVVGRTVNGIVIDAPMDLVWSMTNDVESWPDLFSEYSAVQVLERDGDTVRFRLTTRPDEDGNSWSWVSERTPDAERREVRARRVEPGWCEYMNIHWTYRETDSGVVLTWIQEFRMKPDAPIDDIAMTDRLNRVTQIQLPLIKQRIETVAHPGREGGGPRP
jgi:aromatase